MAGDPYRRAQPGERLRIPAAAWNRLMDNAMQMPLASQGDEFSYRRTNFRIYCQNKTGGTVPQWGVLHIDGVLPTPSGATGAATNQFQTFPAVSGITPNGATEGAFGIAVESIESNRLGMVAIDGVVQVKLDIQDAAHRFATPKPGSTTELQTASSGEATILWKESGTGTGKWGLVRIGSGKGEDIRIGKYEPTGTTGAWSINTTQDIQVYENGTPPSETITTGEVITGVVNHTQEVPHGSWVLCGQAVNGYWYMLEAENRTTGCSLVVGGTDLSLLPGFDQMEVQLLGHTAMTSGPSGPEGCASLQWYSVTNCTGPTGATGV